MSESSQAGGSASEHSKAGTAPRPASRWEDFIDILYAPSDVYERRASSGFGIPLLVVTVTIGLIGIANSGALQPLLDAEFQRVAARQMEKNPQLTLEMMERGRSFGEAVTRIGGFILVPVAVFLIGLGSWLVGKLFDAKQSLAAALMVATYAYVPKIIESVLIGAQALLLDASSMTGRYKLTFSAARFLDPDTASPLLLSMLGRLDLFSLWTTALVAIGLAITGKMTRQRAAVAALLLWLLTGALGSLQALWA